MISEFQPNPIGADPSTQTLELSGIPGNSFSGVFLTLEDDSASGTVDRLSNISGTFGTNGLLSVNIPDLENPSFTAVLTDSFSGSIGDDLDTDDDGTIDNVALLGTVIDAIGIPDDGLELLYSSQLGGVDLAYIGSEPYLVFRDASVGQWFAVGSDGSSLFDLDGNSVSTSIFSNNPTVSTFGAINPTASAAVPFEFSPAMGLIAMGSLFTVSRLRRRNNNV